MFAVEYPGKTFYFWKNKLVIFSNNNNVLSFKSRLILGWDNYYIFKYHYLYISNYLWLIMSPKYEDWNSNEKFYQCLYKDYTNICNKKLKQEEILKSITLYTFEYCRFID